MQKLLSHENGVPGDGEDRVFRYLHPETAHWSHAVDYYTWQDRIVAHRKANNLPPITMAEAENQLCQSLPPGWCSYEKGDEARNVPARFRFKDVVSAMRVFAEWAKSGFTPVSQAEAERRANICVRCFRNVQVSGCGVCAGLAKLITGVFAQLTTTNDARLKTCACCKCLNKAQVWVPLEALAVKNADVRECFPSFCWQRT